MALRYSIEDGEGSLTLPDDLQIAPAITRADILRDLLYDVTVEYNKAVAELTGRGKPHLLADPKTDHKRLAPYVMSAAEFQDYSDRAFIAILDGASAGMFKTCSKCAGPMGAAVGRECDACKLRRLGAGTPDRPVDALAQPIAPPVVKAGDHAVAQTQDGPTSPALQLTPGHPCPTCGKPVAMTAAERQRQYRARKLAPQAGRD